jgi:hypothetical protein
MLSIIWLVRSVLFVLGLVGLASSCGAEDTGEDEGPQRVICISSSCSGSVGCYGAEQACVNGCCCSRNDVVCFSNESCCSGRCNLATNRCEPR